MKIKPTYLTGFLAILLSTLACILQGSPPVSEITPLTGQDGTETAQSIATNTPETPGPCNNVLIPLVLGRQWTYQKMSFSGETATPDPLTSKFGISVAEVTDSQAILNLVDLTTGTTTRSTVDCQDGAILNFPLMTLGSLFGNSLVGDVEITYVSGIFLPSEADLVASNWNMQWQGEYLAAGTITFISAGQETSIILEDSPVSTTWQNAGQETITVPAGTYENAYKVTRHTQAEATLNFEGFMTAATLNFDTIHWFAPMIGLIKTEIVSATLATFGITIPIETTGSVELTETH